MLENRKMKTKISRIPDFFTFSLKWMSIFVKVQIGPWEPGDVGMWGCGVEDPSGVGESAGRGQSLSWELRGRGHGQVWLKLHFSWYESIARLSPSLSLPLLLALFFPLSPVLFDYTSKTSDLLELNIWLFSQSFCPFCNFSTILGST